MFPRSNYIVFHHLDKALAVANQNGTQARAVTVARLSQVKYHIFRSFFSDAHQFTFEFRCMQCIQFFNVGSDDCDLVADFSGELHESDVCRKYKRNAHHLFAAKR